MTELPKPPGSAPDQPRVPDAEQPLRVPDGAKPAPAPSTPGAANLPVQDPVSPVEQLAAGVEAGAQGDPGAANTPLRVVMPDQARRAVTQTGVANEGSLADAVLAAAEKWGDRVWDRPTRELAFQLGLELQTLIAQRAAGQDVDDEMRKIAVAIRGLASGSALGAARLFERAVLDWTAGLASGALRYILNLPAAR